MIRRIGTSKELTKIPTTLEKEIVTAIQNEIALLDDAYGENRNYLETGGYVLLIETDDDLIMLQQIIDIERHPCEWATLMGTYHNYISALFLLNDDFAITVYLPLEITPTIIRSELMV